MEENAGWLFLGLGVRYYDGVRFRLWSTTLSARYYCVEINKNWDVEMVCNRQDWAERVLHIYAKVKINNFIRALDKFKEIQEVEVPRFQDNSHMMGVRLSDLPNGQI